MVSTSVSYLIAIERSVSPGCTVYWNVGWSDCAVAVASGSGGLCSGRVRRRRAYARYAAASVREMAAVGAAPANAGVAVGSGVGRSRVQAGNNSVNARVQNCDSAVGGIHGNPSDEWASDIYRYSSTNVLQMQVN